MKGQSAFELVMLLIVNLIILLLFVISITPIENRISFERQRVLAREVVMTAAAEIDSAAIVGDGFERRLTVPERLRDNTNFTLIIEPEIQRLMIIWGDQGAALAVKILTANVSGNFTHGPQVIRNVRGTVVIEGI